MPPEIENFLNGFALMGVPILLATPLIIEGLKRVLGMPTHWSGVASLVINSLSAVGIYAVDRWPAIEWYIKLGWMVVLATFAVARRHLRHRHEAQLLCRGDRQRRGHRQPVVLLELLQA